MAYCKYYADGWNFNWALQLLQICLIYSNFYMKIALKYIWSGMSSVSTEYFGMEHMSLFPTKKALVPWGISLNPDTPIWL